MSHKRSFLRKRVADMIRLLYSGFTEWTEVMQALQIPTKPYQTDVLTDKQLAFIAQRLPQPNATTGRPAFYNGMKPNIPKRSYTKESNDRDPYSFHFYRYDKELGKARFIVERTNAWFKSFRRIRNRFDYHAASYEAFLYLAILVICVRRLVT